MTFDKNDTYNKVVIIIADELKLDKNTIKPNSTFQDLGADSLDMVQMIMKFEEQFGIEINDQDAEKMTTLQEVVDYINNKRSK